ncbi:MAG: 30S ribosomal protein S4 [Candidatus Aenigmatarchaeota archaeon]
MKRQKKKYEKPLRIWDRERIEAEKKLLKEYGLRRKKEIWRMESILRKYRRIARNLAAKRDKEKEKILLDKLNKLGLLKPDASLDDVLALTVENLLERRLQTLVYRKGLANTIKQARQLIVHGHIALDGRRVRWPSMLIPLADENKIGFYKKEIGEKIEKKS